MSHYIFAAVVLFSFAGISFGAFENCQLEEGGGCSVFCKCGPGLQCEAGTHVCNRAGKEGERCHLTRHCGEGFFCRPVYHTCQRMGNIGEKCVSGFNSAEGRRCNYQKKYWCDPLSHTCVPPSRRGNICGYLGAKEDPGKCKAGLQCKCDAACSIRNFLRDLQGSLSGVAQTIQDLIGKTRFCCKCV